MKNLVLFLSVVLVAIACKKEKCTDTYTISGRLFHNQNSVFEKDEPMKNWEVKFNLSMPRNYTGSKNKFLGSTNTDEHGNFSLTYSCDGNVTGTTESVEMFISSSSNIITGISYILPINQNIHRDFTETSHARIVCEIDNQSDLDTIYIAGASGNFIDSGNIEGISKEHYYFAVPIKGKDFVRVMFVNLLRNNLTKVFNDRRTRFKYGVSYDALGKDELLGSVSIQCQGAPYYDTVRIELK